MRKQQRDHHHEVNCTVAWKTACRPRVALCRRWACALSADSPADRNKTSPRSRTSPHRPTFAEGPRPVRAVADPPRVASAVGALGSRPDGEAPGASPTRGHHLCHSPTTHVECRLAGTPVWRGSAATCGPSERPRCASSAARTRTACRRLLPPRVRCRSSRAKMSSESGQHEFRVGSKRHVPAGSPPTRSARPSRPAKKRQTQLKARGGRLRRRHHQQTALCRCTSSPSTRTKDAPGPSPTHAHLRTQA